MRFAPRWFIRATGLLVLASCEATPAVEEEVVFRSSPLDDGVPDSSPNVGDCDGSIVFDAIQAICDLWPLGGCTVVDPNPPNPPTGAPFLSFCSNESRQIFTGATNPDSSPVPMLGRGRAGHAHADAMLCTLRQLSPQLDGPLPSEAEVDVGIGMVRVRQETGFKSFDRESHAFEGYRRLELDMPVLGKVTTVAQTFRLAESSLTELDTSSTGATDFITGYGLDLTADQREKHFMMKPPGFDVPTPIGVFEVRPEFTYQSQTRVIDSDYDGSTDFDMVNWGSPGTTVHFDDLYGVIPGIAYASQDVTSANLGLHQNKGWFSGIGLGTRASLVGTQPWTPPATAPKLRPNYDLAYPREAEEARPSTYLNATAMLKYPDDPFELLPGWVQNLSNSTVIEAWISLTASLEAGAGGQVALATHEGVHFMRERDGTLLANNLSTFAIDEEAQVNARFGFEVVLHIKVAIDVPIVGEVELIDIHEPIPIPIAGGTPDTSDHHNAWGYAPGTSSRLDGIAEFDGTAHIGQAATDAFLEQCFAEELPEEEIPAWDPEPGDASLLFSLGLVPCNICVALDQKNVGTASDPYIVEANATMVIPSDDPPGWECDRGAKLGCMNMCTFDAESGELTVAKTLDELAAELAAEGDYATAGLFSRCAD